MQEHTETAGHGGAEHASGGLPQFDPQWWGGQAIWLLIIFAVLYVVLSKVLLPKVSGAIDAREGKIAGDIAEARRLKDEAEAQAAAGAAETAEARSRAQKLAADAKAKATAEAAARQAAEEAKLNERLSVAEASIASAREQAMGSVRTIAVDTVQAIVEKLTGKSPDAAEVEQGLAQAKA